MTDMTDASRSARPTILLTHAAWFDGSSWNDVVRELDRRGYRSVAVQLPLTSLADDKHAVQRHLRRLDGPVVLVGHSYGGAVATAAATGNPSVKALVYIAAIVPDHGESVGQVFTMHGPHPLAPALRPDADGLLWVDADAFRKAIAQDASPERVMLLAAAQKPIAVGCLGEPIMGPAWREKPSWFLVAENDRMVSPETQRFTAARMNSSVTSIPSDHAPLLSRPEAVADIIEAAATSTAQTTKKGER